MYIHLNKKAILNLKDMNLSYFFPSSSIIQKIYRVAKNPKLEYPMRKNNIALIILPVQKGEISKMCE